MLTNKIRSVFVLMPVGLVPLVSIDLLLSAQAIEIKSSLTGVGGDSATPLIAQRSTNNRPTVKPWAKPGKRPNPPAQPGNRPNLKPWAPPNSNRPDFKPWVPPAGSKPGGKPLPPWGPPGTRPPDWRPPENRPPNWKPPANRPPNWRPPNNRPGYNPPWVRPAWRPGWRPGPGGWWPIYRPWINVNVKRWYRAPILTGITLLGTAAIVDLVSDALDDRREYVLIPDTDFGLIFSSVSARGINDVVFQYRIAGTVQSATADCEDFRWSSPPNSPRQRPASYPAQQLLNAACIIAYGE